MTCDQARDALLTADLAELDGSRPGPLATHLETCPACRAAADRIATTTRALQAERAIPPSRHPAIPPVPRHWPEPRRIACAEPGASAGASYR